MKKIFPVGFALSAVVLASSCASSDATVSTKPYVEVSSNTRRLSCLGRSSNDRFGSRLARSPVLVAPGRLYSAYAEVEATAMEWRDGARDCRNVSRLHVATPGGGKFRVAFEQNPGAEGQTGNSLELIDWSPDGKQLLMELTLWTYPTDVVNPLIVIYDADAGIARKLPVEELVKEKYPGKCFVGVHAVGFTSEGQVVVQSGPHSRTMAFAAPECTSDTVLWLFHEANRTFEALPKSYRVPRHSMSSQHSVVSIQ